MASQPGAASATVSATARRRDALPEGAYCSSVRITPSQNGGYTVSQSYELPRDKRKKGEYCYIEPRDYTFESTDTMLAHVKAVFGGK